MTGAFDDAVTIEVGDDGTGMRSGGGTLLTAQLPRSSVDTAAESVAPGRGLLIRSLPCRDGG